MIRKLSFAAIVFFAASCDVIDSSEYTLPYDPPTGQSMVLLEEYTGMRCVNCPAASRQAQILADTYGEKLIVVSIHAGGFAVPSGIFLPDLRSAAGNEYFSWFGFAGTPSGAVNRASHQGSLSVDPASWASAIATESQRVTPLDMEVAIDIQEQSNTYRIRTQVTQKEEALSLNELTLTLWLVEDNIVTPQVIPGGIEREYLQRHVLRGALNGTWGERLPETEPCVLEHEYALPEAYDIEHCSVVAFVSVASTRRVLQCVEMRLKRN